MTDFRLAAQYGESDFLRYKADRSFLLYRRDVVSRQLDTPSRAAILKSIDAGLAALPVLDRRRAK